MLQALSERIRGGPAPDVKLSPDSDNRLLPFDVRYAFRYKGASMGPKEIHTLLRNGFPHLGFYLAMKGNADNDEVQAATLRKVLHRGGNPRSFTLEDAQPAIEALDNSGVEGQKMRAVSLYGGSFYREFSGAVKRAESEPDHEDAELFMIPDASYIALNVLHRLTLERGRPLGILRNDRLGQTELPVGMRLTPGDLGVQIDFLSADFERPEHAIIADDTIKTGATMERVTGFWTATGAPTPVTTAARYLPPVSTP